MESNNEGIKDLNSYTTEILLKTSSLNSACLKNTICIKVVTKVLQLSEILKRQFSLCGWKSASRIFDQHIDFLQTVNPKTVISYSHSSSCIVQ